MREVGRFHSSLSGSIPPLIAGAPDSAGIGVGNGDQAAVCSGNSTGVGSGNSTGVGVGDTVDVDSGDTVGATGVRAGFS